MSDVTHVRGIGKVITSAEVFGDFDAVGGDRLAPRNAAPAKEPEAESEDYTPEPRRAPRGWSDKPSVANQATRAPDTIRLGAPVTVILNLSTVDGLQAFNDLNAKAHDTDGPFVAVTHVERQFYEGVFHAAVTYSPISYQQL